MMSGLFLFFTKTGELQKRAASDVPHHTLLVKRDRPTWVPAADSRTEASPLRRADPTASFASRAITLPIAASSARRRVGVDQALLRQGAVANSLPPVAISARGRLRLRLPFWRDVLKASKFVLRCIDFGYEIPFICKPPAFYAKNNASSLRNAPFVRAEIEKLLSKGYIEELQQQPYCCNPLTVVEGVKPRLVLDLRHVNKFVQYVPFKYEDWSCFEQIICKNDYFVSFDFTAGYHHLEILHAQKKYLGFQFVWTDKRLRFFMFNVLPFGLNSACYVFTKLNRNCI
jgi:hypothetical protein